MTQLPASYGRAIWDGRRVLGLTFLLAFLLYMLAPLLIIAVSSVGKSWFGPTFLPEEWGLDWYAWANSIGNIPEVLKNSVIIAAMAVVMSLALALPTGWALGRRKVPVRGLLSTLVLLPRMLPPIAFALGVAKLFYAFGLVDTLFGVALAHVTITLPFALLVLSATFAGLDDRLIEAAEVCGSRPWRTLIWVILPLAMPGILSAAIFVFTTSYNEFTLTLLTYGPHTITLPVKTYLVIGDGFVPVASAISMILLVPSLLVLLLIQSQLKPDKLIGGLKGV
ncbi:MAG TPA: ABC transporter permease [Candidatus Limnocylindrales bacterium]|nr:ABC transporter permease [Candidatus Limnocylindrales bacterium]